MEIEIRKCGSCIYADDDGYFRDDIKIENLQAKWFDVVLNYKDIIIDQYQDHILSIYLRGSIANGTAIDNISDLDIFIISQEPLGITIEDKIRNIGLNLNKEFSFITRFDIGFYTKDSILRIKERVLIKLRSICIWGENLNSQIPNLRPGTDVAVTLLGLENELNGTIDEIDDGVYTESNTGVTCKWLMKRILRAGLELVSIHEKCYTRDLYKCWEIFSKYYPGYSDKMFEALDLAINPVNNVQIVKELLPLAFFIIREAKREYIIK